MSRGFVGLICVLVVAALAAGITGAAEQQKKKDAAAAQVRIEQVEVRVTEVGPVVLLNAENRMIPIFVDVTVAESIHAALTGGKLRRPFTHDLMHSVLGGFGGKVTRVVISLKGTTYYAELTVVLRETTKVFDSRASDAIALAVHFKAPIMVSRELLESAGKEITPPPGATSL
jgi:bifunctional DNase/RNase